MGIGKFVDVNNPCPKCGGTEWQHIVDSLADACVNCLYVRVGAGNGEYKEGTNLKDWFEEVYKKKDEG